MSVSRYEIIHWFTTPKELRGIADEMERHWKTSQPGQDKTVRVIWGKDTELRILVDQDRTDTGEWV